MQFATIELITSVLMGRGRRKRFTQKMPRGGIQAVLSICARVSVDCDTYSTQPLQKIVRARLIRGVATYISRLAGKKSVRPKLKTVSITP
jgi:hypothetical protein